MFTCANVYQDVKPIENARCSACVIKHCIIWSAEGNNIDTWGWLSGIQVMWSLILVGKSELKLHVYTHLPIGSSLAGLGKEN